MEETDPISNPPKCVERYAQYLKSVYNRQRLMPNDWPPGSNEESYTNLALIEQDSEWGSTSVASSTMKYDYVHGRIDNIVAVKKRIEIHEVFYPIIDTKTGESRLFILMDGAPGVGKTTLATKLCMDWAKGELLQEYHLVILIHLRVSKLDSAIDLFPAESESLSKAVTEYYTEPTNLGRRILLIFDGFDEVQRTLTQQSFLSRILKGKILPHISILVTSRPYASESIKMQPRLNRHIELLGFTSSDIQSCIEKSIPIVEADKLILDLKDRLDIASLCYIPLNCRLVLYVYKFLNYNLPDTLTELYEVFVLHTIKHHMGKIEQCNELGMVKSLNTLPKELTEKLDTLCKLAFDGIENSELFFDDHKVPKANLLLGLLTAHQSMALTHVEQHFQFLHLTIQEFLAARHIASVVFPTERKIEFVQRNLSNKSFRMTLLFLAGLTKLNFVPDGEPLVAEPIDLCRQESIFPVLEECTVTLNMDRERQYILLLAQMVYESQNSSASHLIPLKSNKFDLSGLSLSPFDAVVIGNFLSSTPEDHEWDMIDISDCKNYHGILEKRHKIATQRFSIGMTKSLRIGPVDIQSLANLSIQGLQELYHFKPFWSDLHQSTHTIELQNRQAKPSTFQHHLFRSHFWINPMTLLPTPCIINVAKLASGVQPKYLTNVEIVCSGFTLTKKELKVNKDLHVCSFSFFHMLELLHLQDLRTLVCPSQSHIFVDCKECGHKALEIIPELNCLLKNAPNLESLDLSGCRLNASVSDKVIDALSKNETAVLKEINLNGNSIISLQKVSPLLSKGASLNVCGFNLRQVNSTNKKSVLKMKSRGASIDDLQALFTTLQPECTHVEIDVESVLISMLHVASLLLRNQGILSLSVLPNPTNVEFSCEQTSSLVQAICGHQSLESFSISFLSIQKSSIHIKGELQKVTCPRTLGFFEFISEPARSIQITDIPEVFCDCLECGAKADEMVGKVCEVIRKNKTDTLSIKNCRLSEATISFITDSIPKGEASPSEINIMGNTATPGIVNHLLSLGGSKLSSLSLDEMVLSSCADNKLELTLNSLPDYQVFAALEIPRNKKCLLIHYFKCLDLSLLTPVLDHNMHLREIEISRDANFEDCQKAAEMTETLTRHTSLDKITIRGYDAVISRRSLVLHNIRLCPRSLQNLLLFIKPNETDEIVLVKQQEAFNCPKCKTLCKECVLSTFCEVLAECTKLKLFHMSKCHLPNKAMEIVATSLSKCSHVENILLDDAHITDLQALSSLFETVANSPTFQELTVRNIHIKVVSGVLRCTSNDSSHLSVFRKHAIFPIELNMNNTELNESSHTGPFRDLVCQQGQLCSFVLCECSFDSEFVEKMLQNIKTATIQKLHITENTNNECPSVVGILDSLCYNTCIEEFSLTLMYEEREYESVGKLLESMISTNKSLREFHLHKCFIDDVVLQNLWQGLSNNTTIEALDLSGNFISHDERTSFRFGQSLESILKHKFLKSLNISDFLISDIVMQYLESGLTSNALQTLSLDGLNSCIDKPVSSPHWIRIFKCLEQNKSLQTLSIRHNRIGQKGLRSLFQLLEGNSSIATVEADRNCFPANTTTHLSSVLKLYSTEQEFYV